jgi:hypothetical protein
MGSNFNSQSVARFNGNNRATILQDEQNLVMTILASDIAGPGTGSITVMNPAPGGGVSAAMSFLINGAPTLLG